MKEGIKMLEKLQKIEKDQEITTRIQATDNINACYYVLPDGTMITLGFEDGCRTDYHGAIFSYFKNIEYNDWKRLIKEANLLMVIPEIMEAWTLKGKHLTKQQKEVIYNYGLELTRE